MKAVASHNKIMFKLSWERKHVL